MKKKEFIKDKNGKVTNCDSNRSKMNVLEFVIYIDRFSLLLDIKEAFIEGLKHIFYFIIAIFAILLLPLVLFIRAKIAINRSKKEVNYWRNLKTNK
jgi:hypothetical protein